MDGFGWTEGWMKKAQEALYLYVFFCHLMERDGAGHLDTPLPPVAEAALLRGVIFL